MGLLSKQELDTEVRVLMDKVEFIMKSFSVNAQGPFDLAPKVKTLLQVYYEVKAGVPLDHAVNGVVDGEEVTNVSVDEAGSEREA